MGSPRSDPVRTVDRLGNPVDAIHLADYQRRLIESPARFILGLQSRQSGKTFASTLKICLDIAEAEALGRSTTWAIVSRTQRQSKQVMGESRRHLEAFDASFRELDIEWGRDGDGRHQTSTEIVFPKGSRITSLPCSADTIRGLSANVYFDEADIVRDFAELWASASGMLTRGYRILMTTTPLQSGGWIHRQMTAHESVWERWTVDIHQAVAQGLRDRDGKPIDVDLLRRAIDDEDVWSREFLCIWPDQSSVWLPMDLILSCESDGACPEEFAGGPTFIGVDVAIRRDLWVAVVVERVGDVLWVREISTMRGGTFEAREVELQRLVGIYRPLRIAMDRTGIGEQPVERAQLAFGAHRVDGVTFGSAIKTELAAAAKRHFEARTVRIPDGDHILRADLGRIRREIGPGGAPRFTAERDAHGHADRFWALALALHAAHSDHVDLGVSRVLGISRASADLDAFTGVGPRVSLEGF